MSDPYWASVVASLPFSGADGSTTFVDDTGRAWTASGTAQIDTADGAAGLFADGASYIRAASSADFAFGLGDFTIEGFLLIDTAPSGNHSFFDTRPASAGGAYPALYYDSTQVHYYVNNSNLLNGTRPATGTLTHFELSRSDGLSRLFLDGVLQGSSTVDGADIPSTIAQFGDNSAFPGAGMRGRIRYARITKGIARHTASFTPPTPAPWPTYGPAALLNPRDCHSSLILSNGYRTVKRTANGASAWRMVRASYANSTEKQYLEIGHDANGSGGSMLVGFATASAPLDSYVGSNAESWGVQANNTANLSTYYNGTQTGGYGTGLPQSPASGYAKLAHDGPAGKIWLGVSTVAGWIGGGDPAAGTSPTFTVAPGTPLHVALSLHSSPQTCTVRARLGENVGAIPSGFTMLAPSSVISPDDVYPSILTAVSDFDHVPIPFSSVVVSPRDEVAGGGGGAPASYGFAFVGQ